MLNELSSVSSHIHKPKTSYSAKLVFKSSDTTALRTYVDNLKSNVDLNKQIVHTQFFSKSNESFEDSTGSLTSNKVIETILQENKALEEKVEKAMLERNEFQAKSLLNEQIKNEWQVSHMELVEDYHEQIAELLIQNQRKDKAICEMKHLKAVLQIEADLAKKSKFVFEAKPRREVLDVHCLVEEVRERVEEKAREVFMMQSKEKMLSEVIEQTLQKNMMVKALLANPVNRKNNFKRMNSNEFCIYGTEKQIEDLDLSPIEIKNASNSFEEKNGDYDIRKFKQRIMEKSEKLMKISGKNLSLHMENQKLLKKNEELEQKVKKMHSEYYREDMTMEINQDYENSLCYKLQSMSLISINEIDVNHSNSYENDSNEDDFI